MCGDIAVMLIPMPRGVGLGSPGASFPRRVGALSSCADGRGPVKGQAHRGQGIAWTSQVLRQKCHAFR
jgi:hypothetical protein